MAIKPYKSDATETITEAYEEFPAESDTAETDRLNPLRAMFIKIIILSANGAGLIPCS